MMRWTLNEIEQRGLGDFRLCSIAWSDSGSDLLVVFDPPGANAEQLALTFVWATEVEMKMSFGCYSGKPLVFESRFERAGHHSYKVQIQFSGAPDGYISLSCSEISLVG
jgi:hypothetical protein